jgi:uncharacterized membrane protein YkvA (DUF1232 family)
MTGTDVVLYQTKSLVAFERVIRRRLTSRLRALAAMLPFAQEIATAYFCAFDRRTPAGVKLALLGALAGFLLPQRLIPKMLQSLVLGGDVGLLLGALQGLRPAHPSRASAARAPAPRPAAARRELTCDALGLARASPACYPRLVNGEERYAAPAGAISDGEESLS